MSLSHQLEDVCPSDVESDIVDLVNSQFRQCDEILKRKSEHIQKIFLVFALQYAPQELIYPHSGNSNCEMQIQIFEFQAQFEAPRGGSNPIFKYGLVWVKYGFSLGSVRVGKTRFLL